MLLDFKQRTHIILIGLVVSPADQARDIAGIVPHQSRIQIESRITNVGPVVMLCRKPFKHCRVRFTELVVVDVVVLIPSGKNN